ncbi:MAG: hypothetical protein KDK91_20370 [Gammaproteobacteria bacterium]|nr:hypothetical protein [Gammaproteobacteria bacterium]
MCFGGGGGGGDPAAFAREQEARRQAQIAQATAAIEQQFAPGAREQAYAQYANDVLSRNMMRLSEDKQRADRELKFALARSGLAGGSAQADSAQQLGQNYDENVLRANQYAQEQAANLRRQDQTAKSNLLNQAYGGLDATTAARLAQSGLQNNLQLAQNQNNLASLGDLLANVALAQHQGAAAAGQGDARRILADEDKFGTYIPATGGSGYSGRSTRIG